MTRKDKAYSFIDKEYSLTLATVAGGAALLGAKIFIMNKVSNHAADTVLRHSLKKQEKRDLKARHEEWKKRMEDKKNINKQ